MWAAPRPPLSVNSLACEGDVVMSVASKHRFISHVTLQYGVQYHKCVVSARPPNQWPDDLHVPFTDWMDVVCSMHSSVRSAIRSRRSCSHEPAPHLYSEDVGSRS